MCWEAAGLRAIPRPLRAGCAPETDQCLHPPDAAERRGPASHLNCYSAPYMSFWFLPQEPHKVIYLSGCQKT